MWVFLVLVIVVSLYVCVCEREWSASALLVGNGEGCCERHCRYSCAVGVESGRRAGDDARENSVNTNAT